MSRLLEHSVAYRPFVAPWAVELAIAHEKMHWIEEEVPLSEDVADWRSGKMTSTEKEFVTQILRMFTQADVNVGANYHDYLIPVFKNNEIRMMHTSFANREGIHQRAYALLNDTLGLPEGDYSAFLTYKEMKDKHEFMTQADVGTTTGIGLALAKMVFSEGVSLFASFAMLLQFQRRGLMKGMAKIVEWSIRDEASHVEGNTKLFRAFCEAYPEIVTDEFKHTIYDMAREVVRLEDAFIDLAYKLGPVKGLESEEVKTYIRYITDRRLNQLGLKENFGIKVNPLPWLDWIVSGVRHTNFFEGKVTEYEVSGLQGEWTDQDEAIYAIYTKGDCPWCVKAKELLVSSGLKFNEYDLSDDEARQEFYDENGFKGDDRSVPKIWRATDTEKQYIGGYVDLSSYLLIGHLV